MEIKVCGMRDVDNCDAVSQLSIDYMGFIFYRPSPRYVGDNFELPTLNKHIKTIGVFVNHPLEELIQIVKSVGLDGIQLHGDESPQYCSEIKAHFDDILLFKAFRIQDEEDFDQIKSYTAYCDRFIFDTKGKRFGGNGEAWDHTIIKGLEMKIPFLLSGGIGDDFEKTTVESIHPLCIGIDLNSKFEIEPGLKEIKKLKTFIER